MSLPCCQNSRIKTEHFSSHERFSFRSSLICRSWSKRPNLKSSTPLLRGSDMHTEVGFVLEHRSSVCSGVISSKIRELNSLRQK